MKRKKRKSNRSKKRIALDWPQTRHGIPGLWDRGRAFDNFVRAHLSDAAYLRLREFLREYSKANNGTIRILPEHVAEMTVRMLMFVSDPANQKPGCREECVKTAASFGFEMETIRQKAEAEFPELLDDPIGGFPRAEKKD